MVAGEEIKVNLTLPELYTIVFKSKLPFKAVVKSHLFRKG